MAAFFAFIEEFDSKTRLIEELWNRGGILPGFNLNLLYGRFLD